MNKIKHWLKYRRVRSIVEQATRNAFYMQHWGWMHNLYDRLDRVMGNVPQFRLQNYQKWKLSFVKSLGLNDKWLFDPYTLS